RELNPTIRVLVRCAYLRDIAALRRAGADRVFAGEGEVALALTESVLRDLGAVPEQIDRERERVRGELFAEAAPSEAVGSIDASLVVVSGPSVVLGEDAVKRGEALPDASSSILADPRAHSASGRQ